jgi:hypothetical protein
VFDRLDEPGRVERRILVVLERRGRAITRNRAERPFQPQTGTVVRIHFVSPVDEETAAGQSRVQDPRESAEYAIA